ncbi:MAG: threonine synthase [Thermodesulfobacteriota bacterium]
MGYVKGLRCRECHREYPKEALHVCEYCFGPLEVDLNYNRLQRVINRNLIEKRPPNMWRYRELLPLDGEPAVGQEVGFTPFFRAKNLEAALGVKELYIKNDAVNHPTLSFKDRVVAVAHSKAIEFGFKTVACASTGNLANSVAALATTSGLKSYIFVPRDLEQGKILGTMIYKTNLIAIKGNYDEVNRLCSEIAGKYRWAFANINIRPYYAEGSKTYGYEIAEQMGWRLPRHIVVPMAGGSLITKIWKSFKEFITLGLVPRVDTKVHGAQAAGCSPIVTAVKHGSDLFKPVKPSTIAKSLAIGNPADGFYAIQTIKGSGGWAEIASDDEIVDAIKLLAETEGIFTEPAGGVTVAATKKLIEQGKIPRDESVVVSITGQGLKTQEALEGKIPQPRYISAHLADFDLLLGNDEARGD